MRTTINLPDDLLARLKKVALDRGTTMTEFIEESLRASLARAHNRTTVAREIELPTYGSGGVLPGVDLDDSAALLDILESDKDSKLYRSGH